MEACVGERRGICLILLPVLAVGRKPWALGGTAGLADACNQVMQWAIIGRGVWGPG